jgi:hypothetical protein
MYNVELYDDDDDDVSLAEYLAKLNLVSTSSSNL